MVRLQKPVGNHGGHVGSSPLVHGISASRGKLGPLPVLPALKLQPPGPKKRPLKLLVRVPIPKPLKKPVEKPQTDNARLGVSHIAPPVLILVGYHHIFPVQQRRQRHHSLNARLQKKLPVHKLHPVNAPYFIKLFWVLHSQRLRLKGHLPHDRPVKSPAIFVGLTVSKEHPGFHLDKDAVIPDLLLIKRPQLLFQRVMCQLRLRGLIL